MFRLFFLCLICSSLSLFGQNELSIDFTKDLRACSVRSKGIFRGVLPKEWKSDFVNWNASEAESVLVTEQGRSFLRFTVRKAVHGAQFRMDSPSFRTGKVYRVEMTARSFLPDYSVALAIRQIAFPYTEYGKITDFQLPFGKWKKCVTYLHFEKMDPAPTIALLISEPGRLDLQSLKITETDLPVPREEGQTSIRPGKNARNFFRNSSLPLGLQSGWTFGRELQTSAFVSNQRGPTGEKAFCLSHAQIYSEPFQVADPSEENQVSFFYRGKGILRASLNQGSVLRLEPSETEWRRAVLQILPGKNPPPAYILSLYGKGAVLVDGFHAGLKGSSFARAGELEIALALPESDASIARIQFSDDPPEILYKIIGTLSKGVSLKAEGTDLYGRTLPLPIRNGRIDYSPLLKDHPYGQFRIEVSALRNGRRISPENELVVTRLQRPLHWGKDAPDSPFGGHAYPNAMMLTLLKAGGVNWIRLHDPGMEYIGWWSLEPEKGRWRFFDRELMLYRKHHLKLFAQLGTSPKWASGRGRFTREQPLKQFNNPYHDRFWVPDSLEEFARYVRTVAKRYDGVIDEYFVWNEPWGFGFLNGKYDPVRGVDRPDNIWKVFADLQKTAYRAVKSVNPAIKLSGFNTSAFPEWTEKVYQQGGVMESCDLIDYHVYTSRQNGFPGDPVSLSYQKAIGYIREKNHGSTIHPVYMSEGQGAPSGASRKNVWYAGLLKQTLPWKNTEDFRRLADLNTRFMISLFGQGVKRIFLYSQHSYRHFGRVPQYPVLIQADGYPHPQLVAHSALASRVEGKTFRRMVPLKEDVFAFLFEGEKCSFAAILPKRNCAAFLLSSRLPEVKGYDLWGNPLAFPVRENHCVFYVEAPVPAEKLLKALRVDDEKNGASGL